MAKTKTLSLFALSLFVLVLLVGFSSAVDLTKITSVNIPSNVASNTGSFNIVFELENSGAAGNIFDLTNFTSSQSGLSSSFDDFFMADGSNTSVTETITATISFNTGQTGTITGNINVGNTNTATDVTFPFSVQITQVPVNHPSDQEFVSCTSNQGDLDVKKIDIQNNGFSGKEFGSDDEWFLLDEIEVEVTIDNNGNFDVDNIDLFWGLWDTQAQDWVIDFDDFDEINLKDGKDDKLIFDFKIDDDMDMDFDELSFSNNYRLYVMASGTIDDNNAGVLDGQDTCVFDFEEVEVIDESDFVVVDNIDFPAQAQCGDTVEITADVWNIGDNDQDDVSVRIVNNELNLQEYILIGDIDGFDNSQLRFNFEIPNSANAKTYGILFEVYDEDDDIYENDFDDDPSRFTIPLVVSNCNGVGQSDVSVSASLVSGGRAGENLVIRATITNNGDDLSTFSVRAAEFAAWANSVTTDLSTLVLNQGQSQDVTLTLDVMRDASGQQTFFIEVVSDKGVVRQPMTVNIQPRSGFGITGNVISGDALPWVIGILNIILIVIIIIVAVRVARRR